MEFIHRNEYRMRGRRIRGRPRSNGWSSAESKNLEYLLLISNKYAVSADTLFNSMVDAWKNKHSSCENLSITCRKTDRDKAVFLIMTDRRVVAQFSFPTHLLEETNPLKRLVYLNESMTNRYEKSRVQELQISDLKSGMKKINLKAKVLEIPEPRSVITRLGGSVVTNAKIKDETGIIQLPLWNKQISNVSVGDLIEVENARVVTFRGRRQLRVGRSGKLKILEKR